MLESNTDRRSSPTNKTKILLTANYRTSNLQMVVVSSKTEPLLSRAERVEGKE